MEIIFIVRVHSQVSQHCEMFFFSIHKKLLGVIIFKIKTIYIHIYLICIFVNQKKNNKIFVQYTISIRH